MRIYLVGFMGAGKTTLGGIVASSLQVPFFDTDTMLEDQEGKPVSQIFSSAGEDNFRILESAIIRQTVQYDKALIATGGGLPLHYSNMDWMNEHGITIYLQLPEDALLAGLIHHRSLRPLLAELSVEDATDKVISLLKERQPVYERSSMTISLLGETEDDVRILESACRYIW